MDTIRTRAAWGATAPLRHDAAGRTTPMRKPARGIYLHHSVTQVTTNPDADFRVIEHVGVERFGYLSYSYMSHPSGVLAEGAGTSIGAHTEDRNSTTFGLVFVGDYRTRELTREQIEHVRFLRGHLIEQGWLQPDAFIDMHRSIKATACPGDNVARRLAEIRLHAVTPLRPAPVHVIDYPGDHMKRIDTAITLDSNGNGYFDIEYPPGSIVNVVFNGRNPADDMRYTKAPNWDRLYLSSTKTRVVVHGGPPSARIDVSVWVTT